MIDLSNQVAVVTGGSRGIGAASAIMFAQAGADVAVIYRNDNKSATRVIKKIEEFGRKGMAFKMKVEKFSSQQN